MKKLIFIMIIESLEVTLVQFIETPATPTLVLVPLAKGSTEVNVYVVVSCTVSSLVFSILILKKLVKN